MDYISSDLIDYDRFPINQPGPEPNALIERVRADLADDGCAVLKHFLTAQGVAVIAGQKLVP